MLKTPIHKTIVYIARKLSDAAVGLGLGLHFLHMSECPFSHNAGHIIKRQSVAPAHVMWPKTGGCYRQVAKEFCIVFELLYYGITLTCLIYNVMHFVSIFGSHNCEVLGCVKH